MLTLYIFFMAPILSPFIVKTLFRVKEDFITAVLNPGLIQEQIQQD